MEHEKLPQSDPLALEDVGPISSNDAVSMKSDGGFRDNEIGEMASPSSKAPSKANESFYRASSPATKRAPFNRLSSAVIDINALPADVAETLRQFDINGDGQITVTEMVHGAMHQVEQEEKVIFFRRMLIGIIVGWLLTMGAMFGVVYGAIEASKESKVESDSSAKPGATMVTKDNAFVVQTANSDFYVGADGTARIRSVTAMQLEASEGSTTDPDATDYNVLKTSAATANVTFSSNLPDSVLTELKHITVHSVTGATLSLTVHGVLRMPPQPSSMGLYPGALTIITHIGRIVVDGSVVSFYDDTPAEIFLEAGFIVGDASAPVEGENGRRRRLLDGVAALYGIFNAVADLAKWYDPIKYGNQPPPKLPQNFIMYTRRFAPCVANPVPSGEITPYDGVYLGGTLPTGPGIDYCALLNITGDMVSTMHFQNGTALDRYIETEYTIYRVGSEYLRVEYVHPLYPNVTYVEVLDTSDSSYPLSFHYQVDSHTKGMQIMNTSVDGELPVLTGPVYFYNTTGITEQNLVDQALSAPFDFLGTTTFQGEQVRVWALHLVNNSVHATWYDSVSTQQVRRISFGDFGMMDVMGIIPLNETDLMGLSYLFQDPIEAGTTIVNGTSSYLPPKVGISPYDPFVQDFRNRAAEQDPITPMENLRRREQLQKNRDDWYRAKAASADSEEDRLGDFWEGWDGQDSLPEPVPLELLIPDAHLQRRTSQSTIVTTEADRTPAVSAPRRAEKVEVVTQQPRRQLDASLAPRPAFSPTQHCPYNWVARADTCYYFADASWKGTWEQCRSHCAELDATMACVASQGENDFIHSKIASMAAAAGAQAGFDSWVGMRNTDNAYAWVDGCRSDFVPTFADSASGDADGSLRYVAMHGAGQEGGKWKDTDSTAVNHCVCEHSFHTAATLSKRQPSTTPASAPTGASLRPSTVPRPMSKKLARKPDNMTVASGRFETEGLQWFLSLPQVPNAGELTSIATTVYSKVGCAYNNKCANQWLWFQSFKAPYFPVVTVVGNQQLPCTFATVIYAPEPVAAFPAIEISIDSAIEMSFCNDFSALDYMLGSVTISVGLTGMDFVPAPFDEIFTWQVVSIGIGITFLKVDFWCAIDGSGNIQYSNEKAYGLLRRLANQPRGPAMCRCLYKQQTYPGILNTVGGPDIPLIIFSAIPPFQVLAPFLYLMRIRESVTLESYPYVCELTVARTTMTIELHINMGIFTYSVTAINIAEVHSSKSGTAAFVGAYAESPRNADMFLDQVQFLAQRLKGPFTKAIQAIQDQLNSGAVVWETVVNLGGNLANAAKAYFQSQIEGGQLAADAVGDYARALYKLFKPQPVTVPGCFDPYIEEPKCTDKVKVLGKKICVKWSKPELMCGSTSKCIKYCN